ncbi:hypothetical protein [Streptomyces griseorubiginosus]|uniref:hypothetical protein n=1 Tax=Streptomyces griseorubiginosus TaxID=67304 RepID=UPI0036E1B4E9
MRQDGDRVLWRGSLDERQWPDTTPEGGPVRIPFVEPDVRELVAGRQLIGMPAIIQARTKTRDGCMLVEDWTGAGMELMTIAVAPGPVWNCASGRRIERTRDPDGAVERPWRQ